MNPRLMAVAAMRRRMLEESKIDEGADVHRALYRYADDILGFSRDILGIEPWERQAELLLAIQDHDRVAVKSGHKVSKSLSFAIAGIWWPTTRDHARTLMISPTQRQTKTILWGEVQTLWPRVAKHIPAPNCPRDPGTGMRLPTGSDLYAIASTEHHPEAAAGFSSPNLLVLVDEASGIGDAVHVALSGNLAGPGAKMAMASNPTRTAGTYHEIWRQRDPDYRLIHISSEESPNIVEDRLVVPGLAGTKWRDELARRYGRDSAVFAVRVLGDFPTRGEDSIFALAHVRAALERWVEDCPPNMGAAELAIGVDVARFGDDVSVIQPVRRQYAFRPITVRGADGPQLAEAVARVVRTHQAWGRFERCRIVIDGVGVGASLVDAMKRHPIVPERRLEIVDMQAGGKALAEEDYANARAEMHFQAAAWLEDGGMLPPVDDLERDLLAARYEFDNRGRLRAVKKDKLREELGRSPDHGDALCLACYRGKRIAYGFEPGVRPNREEWEDELDAGEGAGIF